MRAFDLVAKEPWLITKPALEKITAIAQRAHEPDFEAVALKQADQLSRDGVTEMRDGVAVINIVGPLFRRANLFTRISGATSVDMLATAFGDAVEDPDVRAVLLNIDSPGGQVGGINELADAIFEARSAKPIYAYVEQAQSAAYWIASAAESVYADDLALIGSIGVVATVVVNGEADGEKTYEFVSSQSPDKRVDPETKKGKAVIQAMLDDLAAVFVGKVARNRGVSEEKVLSDFGQGATVVGEKAVAVGMADGIGSQEKLIRGFTPDPQSNEGGAFMSTTAKAVTYTQAEVDQKLSEERAGHETQLKDAEAKGRTEGVQTERKRIQEILSADEAKDRPKLAATLALETETEPTAAKKLLAAAATEKPAEKPDRLATAMGGVDNPDVGAGGGDVDNQSAEQTVVSILKLTGDLPQKGVA